MKQKIMSYRDAGHQRKLESTRDLREVERCFRSGAGEGVWVTPGAHTPVVYFNAYTTIAESYSIPMV